MYFNKAIIIGNLTRDPEIRAIPSGTKVATLGIATNRVWKDKNGVRQENTDYHSVVVFGRQAETVSQYLRKGSSVMVEGRMQTRSWDGQDGVKRYRTEVVADRVQFGPRRDGGGPSTDTSSKGEMKGEGVDSPSKGDTGIDYPQEEINPEDIPF
ncbi:MAG: single-stranded DNA-binding protein [Candidatus Pacebacteria bacterium]|nr:single-stranded DNA-binding protein [Candidatus Paceibacterota bacterium]